MTEYQEVTKKEWKKSALIISVLLVFVVIGSLLLIVGYVYVGVVLFIIGVVLPLYLAVSEEKGEVYSCPKCGHEFEISAFKSLISPHGITKKEGQTYDWKYLNCPVCHTRSKMFRAKKD